MKTNDFKNFVKFILLAQTASDAGKGYISTKSLNCKNAIDKNYGLKDKYIAQAISFGKKCKNVTVGHNSCDNILLFNVRGYGQISFHTFKNWEYLKLEDEVAWNEITGGSLMTCTKLARKLNFPFYKHKLYNKK